MLTVRNVALGAAAAALLTVTAGLAITGPSAVGAPDTAAHAARVAVLLALPGAMVAALVGVLGRLRLLAAAALGVVFLVAFAVVRGDAEGVIAVPAAVVLGVAGAVGLRRADSTETDQQAPDRGPRGDLVGAGILAGLLGVVGRAVALGDAAGLGGRLNLVASGLVLLVWPVVALALLPDLRRSRLVVGLVAAVVAVLVWRSPAGGEAWLLPGVGLLLLAALLDPDPDVVPDRRVPRLAALLAGLVGAGLLLAELLGRSSAPASRVAGALAVAPLTALVALCGRVALPAGAGGPAARRGPAVLIALVIVAGLVVEPAAPSGSEALQLAGGKVRDAGRSLERVDARYLADQAVAGDIAPGARCYFVRGADRGSFEDQVACGPASAEAGWALYPVALHGLLLAVAGEPEEGQTVDVSRLHRPDGLSPPAATGDRPSGRVVATDFTAALREPPGDVSPVDGTVLAGATTVRVEAVAQPETVAADDGADQRAPDGFRFVAIELDFESDGFGRIESITLELVDGPHRVDLTPQVHPPDSGSYDEGWVVAVEPDDGLPPVLAVTYRGRTQDLDVASGERLTGSPLLYEPRSAAVDVVVPASEITVEIADPAPHTPRVELRQHTIEAVELRGFDPMLGWPPGGQAWLVVTVDDLGTPIVSGSQTSAEQLYRFDPRRSFSLTVAGRTLTPGGVHEGSSADLDVVFAVDASTRTASFQVAPRWLLLVGEEPIDLVFPPTDVDLAL